MQAPEQTRELEPGDAGIDGSGEGCDVPPGEPSDRIERYHAFAAQHESIVAKSLFSAAHLAGRDPGRGPAALSYLAPVPTWIRRACLLRPLWRRLRTCFLAGMDDRSARRSPSIPHHLARFPPRHEHTHTWMITSPACPATSTSRDPRLRAPLASLCARHDRRPLVHSFGDGACGSLLAEVYRKAALRRPSGLSCTPGAPVRPCHAGRGVRLDRNMARLIPIDPEAACSVRACSQSGSAASPARPHRAAAGG